MKDHGLLYVNATLRALRDSDGEIECFVRSEVDITKFRLLRESKLIETRYRELLESMPDAIIVQCAVTRV